MRLMTLKPEHVIPYLPLTFQINRQYLLHCDQENIIAVGASDAEGEPCGLILSLTTLESNEKKNGGWILISIFVKEAARRRGIGRELWDHLRKEIKMRGGSEIRFQAVLNEERLAELIPYVTAMGFHEPKKLAQIFGFNHDSIERSPFVRGTLAEAFQSDLRFCYRSFDQLTEPQMLELQNNEGGWYPAFVSPLIGKEQMNKKCTIFAVDPENNKIAGWITALDVNNCTRILYRSFFTREEYRDTPVGFFIFIKAIKNHLNDYRDRGGLASIPVGNDRALRFCALFFRDAYDHLSYEIESQYHFDKQEEGRE